MKNAIGNKLQRLFLVLSLMLLSNSSDIGLAREPNAIAARLETLENKLSRLDRKIQRLEDSKAIKRLQRAYGYYVDKGLSDEIKELFSDTATAEIGGYGVFVGKDRISELYRYLLNREQTTCRLYNHMILQGVVNVEPGGMRAKGRWRALIQIGEPRQYASWAEGPYENEYIKEQGVWRISKLHWYMTVSAPYESGWHRAPRPMRGPLKDLPPDRPPTEKYQAYPSAYLPIYHYDNPVSGGRIQGFR